MAPKTSEQFEEIRESRKQQIMDVALKLFADKGYNSTSISSIAKEAEISKGLLYNYFDSKEALMIQITEQGFEEMLRYFDPNKDGELTKDEFIYFINEVFNLMSRKLPFYKLYFSLILQPSVWKLFEGKFAEVIGPLLTILSNYYKNKGSEDPEAEAILIGALLDGIGFNYIFNPDLYPLDRVKKIIIERFI
ncbi:MAG: TetR/AcrR family transcriptional regulator [Bacteroidales bacterium]|nr:TetR/AcrR family transcriptional regulator [Bacteroidales bacterium]